MDIQRTEQSRGLQIILCYANTRIYATLIHTIICYISKGVNE